MLESSPILEIENLKTYFFLEKSTVRAVDGVNLSLPRKSTLGVVGESGCGKSVMAMSVMRLIQSPPGKIVDGHIYLRRSKGNAESIDLAQLDARGPEMRAIRGGEVAIVFQEPMMSLNPLYKIGEQIAETVQVHQGLGRKEALDRALEMLSKVQIGVPRQRLNEYPHQLSGGMRQRVMIALALSCNPSILFGAMAWLMGLIRALKKQATPLPFFGRWAERLTVKRLELGVQFLILNLLISALW